MGFVDMYTQDVWRQRKLVPQYPPAGRLAVGDVLEKHRGVWQKNSSLKSMGFEPTVQDAEVGAVDLQSEGTVSIETKFEGTAPEGVFTSVIGEAEAGVAVTFTGEFGYVLSLSGVVEREMTNIGDLVSFITATRRWNWDLSFLVVTSVYDSGTATVLTSSKQGATAVLKAKAELKPGGVSLADLAAGFDYAAGSGLSDKWVAVPDMTPLFRGRRITLREVLLGGRGAGHRALNRGAELHDLAVDSLAVSSDYELVVDVEEFDPTSM